ncbi:hypothetical protein [Anaplasma marginale]|nr:hypothetical protein [Anaplasma marginale]
MSLVLDGAALLVGFLGRSQPSQRGSTAESGRGRLGLVPTLVGSV